MGLHSGLYHGPHHLPSRVAGPTSSKRLIARRIISRNMTHQTKATDSYQMDVLEKRRDSWTLKRKRDESYRVPSLKIMAEEALQAAFELTAGCLLPPQPLPSPYEQNGELCRISLHREEGC